MTDNQDDAVDHDAVEFVRLGGRVSHHFTVRVRNLATLQAMMAAIPGANEFDPQELARTIGPVFDDAMGVEFGAEGSEVLYVGIPYFPNQRNGSTGAGRHERYTTDERQALAQRVIDWARSVHADEISAEQRDGGRVWNAPGDDPYKIRIWWD